MKMDHVTVNVNPRRMGREGAIVYQSGDYTVRIANKGFKVFKESGTHAVAVATIGYSGKKGIEKAMQEIQRRKAVDRYKEHGLKMDLNPNVGREPNGPHIVGTTAYQVGVQEGERGTRKSKPTNVQIKDAIEAAYPQYKRTLQPSYVRKLASVYSRQWKAGVKDGKATKKANKGRRGKNPSKTQWYDAGYTFGEQERRGADVGIAIDPDQTSGRQFEFMWSRAGESTRSYSKKRAEFIKGFYDAWTHMQRGGRKKRNPVLSYSMSVKDAISAWEETGRVGWYYPRKKMVSLDGHKAIPEREAVRKIVDFLRKQDMTTTRPNPDPMTDADRLYREFHGKGPTQTTEVRTVISSRDNLAELGQLCELDIHLMTDEKVKIKFPSSGRNVVMLASSPDGRQLYFEGGNQTVDLRQLGMSGRDWVRDNMALGVLMVVTYRTEKGFDKFELIDYFHKLGEVTGQKPVLTYDTINHLLSVVGGQYEVRPEGIVN